jgi:hypothetical protein
MPTSTSMSIFQFLALQISGVQGVQVSGVQGVQGVQVSGVQGDRISGVLDQHPDLVAVGDARSQH